MKAEEFIDRLIKQFGEWKPRKGEARSSAEFRKERIVKAVVEQYEEDDLDLLWDLVEKNCEYMPTIKNLTALMAGRKLAATSIPGFVRSRFDLLDRYTTGTAAGLGMVVEDFMDEQKIDKLGSMHLNTEEENLELVTRSSCFWPRISETLKNMPNEIKERVFYRERCRDCGKRIFDERKAKEFSCRLCGLNIMKAGNTVKDAGGQTVGAMLAAVVPVEEKQLEI
jgi:ribosomal protein L37AE/L43A